MHLNAPFRLVPDGLMLKLTEVEIRTQLAINAAQHIEVEGRGNTGWIVISKQHAIAIFDQVGADQKRIARQEPLSQVAQELDGALALEISDSAAEKQNQ